MRENAFQKARRYISEGRLLVTEVTAHRITALCRGDGAIYALGYQGNEWTCECPAVTRHCSHLQALRLVTIASTGLGRDIRIGNGDVSRFEP